MMSLCQILSCLCPQILLPVLSSRTAKKTYGGCERRIIEIRGNTCIQATAPPLSAGQAFFFLTRFVSFDMLVIIVIREKTREEYKEQNASCRMERDSFFRVPTKWGLVTYVTLPHMTNTLARRVLHFHAHDYHDALGNWRCAVSSRITKVTKPD